ncbi:MAG TPA: VWA domain-containing protein [Terriglobales bacterium]|nr:VWA domain-containing protein [Terriglobales bacterium]
MSLEAVPLDAAPGNQALAEAAEKNCAFVLYSLVRPIETSSQYQPSYSAQTIGTRPVITATVEYLLRRVPDGASYAAGTAKSEEMESDREAILQAVSRATGQAVADLGKGGNARGGEHSEAGTLEKIVPVPSRSVSSGSDFCAWLPTDISHADSLRGVCVYAMSLPERMPNFICQQSTSRFQGHNRLPSDLITATVRYEDGGESYSDLKLNGRPVEERVARTAGLWSSGQFEASLRAIFHVSNQAVFQFAGEKAMSGHSAWVFTFRIARQNEPLWQLRGTDKIIAPPYAGEVWVDQKTGAVLRFRSAAKNLPRAFPIQSAEMLTDYDNVAFGDGTEFVLPASSSVATQYQGMEPTRNVMQFQGCHKFRAETRVLLDVAGGANSDSVAATSGDSLKAELEQNQTIYDILREQAIREDEAQLEAEHRQDMDMATVGALWKLAALERQRQSFVAQETAAHDRAAQQSNTQPSVHAEPAQVAAGEGLPGIKVPIIKVNVDLVPVSVVTRDRSGHAVGNLVKEDFRLFDERKLQVISRFSVEQGEDQASAQAEGQKGSTAVGAAPVGGKSNPAVAENNWAYVFDDLHATQEDLLSAKDAAARHFAELRPEDRAAVFTTSGEIGVNFTADREKLQAALKGLKAHPLPGWNCPPMSYYEADQIVNHADTDASGVAIRDAGNCAHSGTAQLAERLATSRALEVTLAGRVDSEHALGILTEVIARTAAMPGRRTIVLVSPGFLTVAPDTQNRAMALIDRAVQAGIVVNTLDVGGVPATGVDATNPGDSLARAGLDQQEATERNELMADLAYGTGGTFFHNNNDMNEGFRQTAEIPEYIYVLGFSPQKLDGKFHRLKVGLNTREKLTVQARPGYYAIKGQASP